MATSDELLDLEPSQRNATFRYKILDQSFAQIGVIHPDSEMPPSISLDTTRSVKHDLRGFNLPPPELAQVNPITDRIAPEMVLENGAVFPLGVYVFVDASGVTHSYGDDMQASLLDVTFMLDQEVTVTVGYGAGYPISLALAGHFAEAGITYYVSDAGSAEVGAAISFPSGTSRTAIMNALCDLAGCYPVYMDNSGLCRVRTRPDLTTIDPVVSYQAGRNIMADSIVTTTNLLSCPNQYTVIDSSGSRAGATGGIDSTPIFATYRVPDAAPHSIHNRGFAITKVVNVQGLADNAAAYTMAQSLAQQDAADFTWVTFNGPPDPRHDCFDVVEFLGDRYREVAWSMTLAEGSPMKHDIRRIYI